MLATLCSKPAPMKANRHQKISTSRAPSLLVRAPIQTARQTRTLQSTPRTKSSSAGACIFAATVEAMKVLAGALPIRPEAATAPPSSIDPTRLPAKLTSQTLATEAAETVLERAPTTMVRLLPVNSSDPAKITSVSATPKEAPITVLVAGEPAPASGAPMAKMRTMPKPT